MENELDNVLENMNRFCATFIVSFERIFDYQAITKLESSLMQLSRVSLPKSQMDCKVERPLYLSVSLQPAK